MNMIIGMTLMYFVLLTLMLVFKYIIGPLGHLYLRSEGLAVL